MKVFMIWKALVHEAYHSRLAELAKHPGLELFAGVPLSWGSERLLKPPVPAYRVIPLRVVFSGHHHTHWFPDLSRLTSEIRPDIVHIEEEPYNLSTFLAVKAARRFGARAVFVAWQNIFKKYPLPFFFQSRRSMCPGPPHSGV